MRAQEKLFLSEMTVPEDPPEAFLSCFHHSTRLVLVFSENIPLSRLLIRFPLRVFDPGKSHVTQRGRSTADGQKRERKREDLKKEP